jgi:hypothetical protein
MNFINGKHEGNKSFETIDNIQNEFIKSIDKKAIYDFKIINDSKEAKQAILFGLNIFIFSGNFGSDSDIKISEKSSEDMISFVEKNVNEEHKTSLEFIELDSQNKNQLSNIIRYINIDKNGSTLDTPIIITSFYRDDFGNSNIIPILLEDKEDKNIIPIRGCGITIDGNSYFKLTVEPETELNVKFYGKKV